MSSLANEIGSGLTRRGTESALEACTLAGIEKLLGVTCPGWKKWDDGKLADNGNMFPFKGSKCGVRDVGFIHPFSLLTVNMDGDKGKFIGGEVEAPVRISPTLAGVVFPVSPDKLQIDGGDDDDEEEEDEDNEDINGPVEDEDGGEVFSPER